ncbi:hypothetical protein GLOIN_2v1480811 [Rhizophagus clarus]|uniref:C2H2-type domain-containing protein n=1 Tax=Rhizophagus clarus TaxID=94130 RepID=A0A8H3M0M3_9GLOM|nr:hypothetical protein GLOIN_2v1480811 [Rhizophagus clarus]
MWKREKSKVVNPIPDPQLVNQTPVPVSESQKEAPILGIDYITEEEAKNWVSPNARKPGEHYKTWGKRLVQKWKELDLGEHDIPISLDDCLTLYHDLEQYDPEAVRQPTLKELEKYSKVSPRDEPSEVKQQDGQVDSEAGPGPATQANRKKQRKMVVPITAKDIHFEECPVGRDLERPHQNRSLMTKWVGEVPSPEDNPAYAFIQSIGNPEEYKKIPYMPQLMGLIRPKITEVLQTELHRKDQIKSTIVALCMYSITKRNPDGTRDTTYEEKHHRGGMRPILIEGDIDEHITQTIGKIDNHIEKTLKKGSGYVLERILEITIEAYTLRRAIGGSYKPTPKKLANTKCTINPDNKGLIDPETNALSEKCLQGAIGCYFAHQDGKTKHLERIFRANDLKQYLEKVKLDGILMPTPICPRIFKKIEEMNPDISINVWGWNEKTATSKSIIFSKNPKRPHVIYLLALTDITKSEDDKYAQKNHFLWIKNHNGLRYRDTKHHEKRYTCNRCDISWPSEASLNNHQDYCHGLAIKHERIVTEEDKKKFVEADTCWICKGKFNINIEEIKRLESKIVSFKAKLKTFKKVTAEYNGIQTTIEKATKAITSEKAKADKVLRDRAPTNP